LLAISALIVPVFGVIDLRGRAADNEDIWKFGSIC